MKLKFEKGKNIKITKVNNKDVYCVYKYAHGRYEYCTSCEIKDDSIVFILRDYDPIKIEIKKDEIIFEQVDDEKIIHDREKLAIT